MAGLFKKSDSLFHDGKPFSSADGSLFMIHKPSEVQDSKSAKNSNLIQPIEFRDWRRTHQMTSSRPCKYAWQNSPDLPGQATINHLKLFRSPLWGLWHSCRVRSCCLIQHSALPHAVSATRPHPSCHKSHKGLLTNFK